MRLGLLISGTLGFDIFQHLLKAHSLIFVMTDKDSVSIKKKCKESFIPCFVGNPRNGKSTEFLSTQDIDVLISVNYLFLIEADVFRLPKRLAFNIHGSLLPKYRGRTPHVWAIINNETETGITAHTIDAGCDTGDIIEQIIIPIEPEDTGASILNKFRELYAALVDLVLKKVENETLNFVKQDHSKATFFGKRTPKDGRINWDWQKERIKNWVRAQSYPYPGAYTYYKTIKVIIDEIEASDYGYDYAMPNGMVLTNSPLRIKTQNGVVKIKKMRNHHFTAEVGEILT